MYKELHDGDPVRLNSGGPVMFVHPTQAKGEVMCLWVGDEGEVKFDYFNETMLTKITF